MKCVMASVDLMCRFPSCIPLVYTWRLHYRGSSVVCTRPDYDGPQFLLTFGFVHLKCLKHQQRRSDLRHWLEARQRKAVNGVTCNLWCNSTKNNYIWRNHSTESVQGFSYSFCWNYFLLQKWSQWKLSTVRTLGLSWVTWIFFMDRHIALRVGFFNVIFQSFWQHRLDTIYIL